MRVGLVTATDFEIFARRDDFLLFFKTPAVLPETSFDDANFLLATFSPLEEAFSLLRIFSSTIFFSFCDALITF
jgi:hypothetical protein